MRFRSFGALALLASIASACGGSEARAPTASVTLLDSKGRAIAGVTVIVAGQSVVTDANGAARLPSAPSSYDIAFISPQDNTVYAFQGLTGTSAVVTAPFDFEPGWTGLARITVGSRDNEQLVTVATSDDPSVDVSGGTGDIELHWTSGTTASVHLEAYSYDAAAKLYTARASADLTLHDADSQTWQPAWTPIAPADSHTAAARIETADGSPATVSAFLTNGVFPFPSVTAQAGLIDVPSAFVTPSTYLHAASSLPGGAEVHIESATLVAPLTLPAPIDALSPDDGARVSAGTAFTTTGQGTITVEMAPADAASSTAPRVRIAANGTPHMPDLSALGIRSIAGKKLMWRATEHLDDAVADVDKPFFTNVERASRRYARTPVRTATLDFP